MEELLNKLLEAEILTSETKAELLEAFDKHFEAELASAKEEAELSVRAELTEQWIKEREVLIEAIDSKVGEYLEAEVADLKEDVERFRDLEAEYAEKIVESKASMVEELKADMAKLIESMDGFLEERLAVEFQELNEDIQEVKKNNFGRAMFEAFASEFKVNFVDEDSIQAKLHESEEKLAEAAEKIEKMAKHTSKLERAAVLESLLAPLSDYHKEVMGSILETITTEKLNDTYEKFIGRILKESVDTSEKEEQVLAEGEQTEQTKTIEESVKEDLEKSKLVLKTGDADETVAEQLTEATNALTPAQIKELKKLSGIA